MKAEPLTRAQIELGARAIRETMTKKVFPQLRKLGLVARANFLCCGGCASADLHEFLKDRPKKRGAIFWHSQDDERLREHGYLFLNFGAREQITDEMQDRQTETIGWMLTATAREHGLKVTWDGTPEQRIRIEIAA